MNKKQTLIDRDYSDWGIVKEGILGTINTYGTTLDYNNDLTIDDFQVILRNMENRRTDDLVREFIYTTNEAGYRPSTIIVDKLGVYHRSYNDSMLAFQLALREQVTHDSAMDLAITGTAMNYTDDRGNVSRIPMI